MSELTPEKRAELRAKAIALRAISGGGPDRERAFKALHLELTEATVLSLLDALDAADAENAALNIRRREGRGLLQRLVKYVTEDRAETPGKTRLARLTEQVDDYLNRTHDPKDILR